MSASTPGPWTSVVVPEDGWPRRIAALALAGTFAFGALVITGEATTPGNTTGHLQVGPLDLPVDARAFLAGWRTVSGALALLGAAGLGVSALAAERGRRRLARVGAAVLALATLAAGMLAIARHPIQRPEAFDVRDDFLYYMGTKYFPELGYFEHYECALWAEREAGGRLPPRFNSMRDNRILQTKTLLERGAPPCRRAFSAARWRAFRADHAFFVSRLRAWRQLDIVFVDHGFNGTPVLRAMLAALERLVPARHGPLTLFGFVNLGVVALALLVVFHGLGWREALVLALVLFTYSGDTFGHVMAIPRYVWLATLVSGVTALHRERFAAAGALLTAAASLKVFPALWLAGPMLVLLVRAVLTTRGAPAGDVPLAGARPADPRALARRHLAALVGAAAATAAVLFAVSLVGGHQGLHDWVDFAAKMDINGTRLGSARVGFKFNWLRPLLGVPGYGAAEANLEAPLLGSLTLWHLQLVTSVALAAAALRRALLSTPAQASILVGFTLLFVFLGPVRYYYAALLGLSLLFRHAAAPRAFAATSCALLGVTTLGALLHTRLSERAQFNIQYSVSLTVFLIGLLAVWEWREWRERSRARAPW